MNNPLLRLHISIVAFFFINTLTSIAIAQTPSSATAIGNAGAGRAAVEAVDIHDLNPANLVHLPGRDVHTWFTQAGWDVGITDNSRDVLFPGAFSYEDYKVFSGHEAARVTDMRLSLAEEVAKGLSFGVTGHQATINQDINNTFKTSNLDAALTWVVTPNLGLALVEYNFLNENQKIPDYMKPQVRTGAGLNYLYNKFIRLKFDVVSSANNDFQPCSSMFGYEIAINQFILFRMGYGTEPENQRESIAGGFGFSLPRFRLNYGYQSTINGNAENRHSVDLGIPF